MENFADQYAFARVSSDRRLATDVRSVTIEIGDTNWLSKTRQSPLLPILRTRKGFARLNMCACQPSTKNTLQKIRPMQFVAMRMHIKWRSCARIRTRKSGLKIEGRHALRQLIGDVESGDTSFDVILVDLPPRISLV